MEEKVIEFPDCIKDLYGYRIKARGEKIKITLRGISDADRTCVEDWFRIGVALRTIWKPYRVVFVDGIVSYEISRIKIRREWFTGKYRVVLYCTCSHLKPTFRNREVLRASLFILNELAKVESVSGTKKVRIPFEKIQKHAEAFSYIINSGYFYDFFLCGCHVSFSIRDDSLKEFRELIERTRSGLGSCNGNTLRNLCLSENNS